MSRTDKDRPYLVQIKDPLNQRFRKKGSYTWPRLGTEEHFWKPMWASTTCWCCSNRYYQRFKRKRRSGWKREVELD